MVELNDLKEMILRDGAYVDLMQICYKGNVQIIISYLEKFDKHHEVKQAISYLRKVKNNADLLEQIIRRIME